MWSQISKIMLPLARQWKRSLLGQHQNPTLWMTCRLYKGIQQCSKMQSNFDGNRIIIEHWLMKAFQYTTDGGDPKRTQLGCLLVMYYYVMTIVHYLNIPKRSWAYIHHKLIIGIRAHNPKRVDVKYLVGTVVRSKQRLMSYASYKVEDIHNLLTSCEQCDYFQTGQFHTKIESLLMLHVPRTQVWSCMTGQVKTRKFC